MLRAGAPCRGCPDLGKEARRIRSQARHAPFLGRGLYIFAASWLVMWWLTPFWRATPPETLEGTAFVFAGPVFMAIALSVPVGIVLISLGMALHSGFFGAGRAASALLVAGLLAIAASVLVASTMPYFPNVLGILGGAIMVLFLASVRCWGRVRAIEG
jgi:hypothetical protein